MTDNRDFEKDTATDGQHLVKRDAKSAHANEGSPEAPANYTGSNNWNGNLNNSPKHPKQMPEYEHARKLLMAAQIAALVSLVFGGVILSTASVIVALIGLRAVRNLPQTESQNQVILQNLNRLSKIAIAAACIAFALNLASFIYLYPMIMQVMQSGDISSIISANPNGAPPSEGLGTSTWG